MTKHELPKAYDFKSTEARIYAMWEAGGYFQPWNDPNKPGFDPSVKPFVITIPPPNVTGELHLGHAMFVSVEDLMIRYHRMKGIPTLWVPGTDHAGIATQLMVERDLLKNEEVTREELGREEFLKRTWEWKHKYGGIITNQIRRLGASCDWTRERFTLDEGLSRAVREAFVRLYEKGLIYRGPRLINWSPGLKTAVSDLEVEYEEEEATLYYFKYMIKPSPLHPSPSGRGEGGEGEFIPVATIRPETILGDTAVAVHPQDERYKKYIGRTAIVPILGREIPVIADEYVSMEFGTGALKITPGHDPNDYAIAQRHNLPVISVLDAEAKVNENGGKYQGQDRFEARKNLWADMKAAGLVIKEEPYRTTIPRSQRGGEIVEPMISTQWFVKIEPLAKAAIEAVKDGRIRIVPERFEKVYFNWMENIKDWCISRQLWWGHRIPVWYCPEGHMTVAREDPTQCAACGSKDIHQDEDVLDTWFSSGLWPFSTLGWPEETPDYKYFYPTSYMETGYDILFFWVARMIMSGLEFTGQIPFHTVYLHGLVRDEHGQKMSKTKGNVIDPLTVMDEFGTDALRFTLLVGSTPGNDMNLSVKKVEANRNFANKLWNAGRFVINAINSLIPTPFPEGEGQGAMADYTLADSWIWAKLQQLIRDVERQFQNFQYGQAGQQIYDFLWSDFADWYVEIAKEQLKNEATKAQTVETLARVLDICLRLLHPFTPFVTEEIWGHLRQSILASPISSLASDWPTALITAKWPQPRPPEGWEEAKSADFELIQEIVRSIRNLRAEKNVTPAKKIAAVITAGNQLDLLESQKAVIAALAGLDPSQTTIYQSLQEKPADSAILVVGTVEIYLPLAGMVDLAEERARLEKELQETEAHIARLEKLLASDFANKAPAPVVQKERDKLAAYKATAEKIKAQLQ
ncbi:MAG: valine--tRNA ligase [Chloroflexota bacterium]|nr:valine--tRNA ligase [Chloroflexota bacterium]MBI5702410.1 valine--tRNA ligase [Chloroflexota bacterium]